MRQEQVMKQNDVAKPAAARRAPRPQPLTAVSAPSANRTAPSETTAAKAKPPQPATPPRARPAQPAAPTAVSAPPKVGPAQAASSPAAPAKARSPQTPAPTKPAGPAPRAAVASQGAKAAPRSQPRPPERPVEETKVVELDLKRARKAREQALEADVHGTLLDTGRDHTERAAEGFMRLAEKLIADVNEQFEHVQALQAQEADVVAVDGEIARLLRMIEKRSKIFDEVEEALQQPEHRRPT